MAAQNRNGESVNFLDSKLPPGFWDKCIPEPNSGCWLWIGAIDAYGYGNWWSGSSYVKPHRVAYEAARGPIAAGLVIDHLCRNRCCINPLHLEPVTNAENVRRGAADRWSEKKSCSQGHAVTTENTLIKRGTQRICRECNRLRAKAWRERKHLAELLD